MRDQHPLVRRCIHEVVFSFSVRKRSHVVNSNGASDGVRKLDRQHSFPDMRYQSHKPYRPNLVFPGTTGKGATNKGFRGSEIEENPLAAHLQPGG
jgi:hypothetical protein